MKKVLQKFLCLSLFLFSTNLMASPWPVFSTNNINEQNVVMLTESFETKSYKNDQYSFSLDTQSGYYGMINATIMGNVVALSLIPIVEDNDDSSVDYDVVLAGNVLGQITMHRVELAASKHDRFNESVDEVRGVVKEVTCIEGGKAASKICKAVGLDQEAQSFERRTTHWKKKFGKKK